MKIRGGGRNENRVVRVALSFWRGKST